MAANVEERVRHSALVTGDDKVFAGNFSGEEFSRLGEIAGPAGADPRSRENAFAFLRKDLGASVPARLERFG